MDPNSNALGQQWRQTSKFAVYDLSETTPPKNIFQAAERGDVEHINIFVDSSIEFDINQKDSMLRTALHWAAEMGRLEVAQLLLEYGCDVNISECNGRTAVHLAARALDVDMLQLLLGGLDPQEQEKLVNQPDKHGITPMYLVVQRVNESQAALDLMLKCGGKYSAEVTY